MNWDGVLVRFGEIGIKSQPVRRRMLDKLRQNLLDQMLAHGVEGDANPMASRIWLVGPDADALAEVACHTFGVVSASPARKVAPNLADIGAAAADLALRSDWTSFAIRAHRDGKHEFKSQDIGREVGSSVFVAAEAAGRKPKVDLSQPDIEIHVDCRADAAFVYTEKRPGPGGLPKGAQGKVVALISDRASCVAAWLMMRRGCQVVALHAGTTGSMPMDNLEVLRKWGLADRLDLLPICTGFVSKAVLFEAAQEIVGRSGAQAFVTGDTLDSDLVIPEGRTPVLRPTCGLAPEEMERLVARIGLDDEEPEHIFSDDAHETLESAMSMHRLVDL